MGSSEVQAISTAWEFYIEFSRSPKVVRSEAKSEGRSLNKKSKLEGESAKNKTESGCGLKSEAG